MPDIPGASNIAPSTSSSRALGTMDLAALLRAPAAQECPVQAGGPSPRAWLKNRPLLSLEIGTPPFPSLGQAAATTPGSFKPQERFQPSCHALALPLNCADTQPC